MKSIVAVAVVVLAGAVLAQGPGMGRRPFGGPAGEAGPSADGPLVRLVSNAKVAEKIGLKAEQIASIKGIAKEQRQASKDLRARMRAAMQKQAELLRAEKVDEAAVMAAIDELFEVRKEMAKVQTRQVIRVKALLTPEQITAAMEELNRNRQERKMRRAKRPMPPPAPKDEPPEDGEGEPEE